MMMMMMMKRRTVNSKCFGHLLTDHNEKEKKNTRGSTSYISFSALSLSNYKDSSLSVGWSYIFVIDKAANTLYRAIVVCVAEMFTSLCIPQPVVIALLCQYISRVTFRDSRACNSILQIILVICCNCNYRNFTVVHQQLQWNPSYYDVFHCNYWCTTVKFQ